MHFTTIRFHTAAHSLPDFSGLLYLFHCIDHRKHYGKRPSPGRSQKCFHLSLQHLWFLQRKSDTAYPQKWIFLFIRCQIRYTFVTSHIQGTYDQRFPIQKIKYLLIFFLLFPDIRHFFAFKKQVFRTVQPNPLQSRKIQILQI